MTQKVFNYSIVDGPRIIEVDHLPEIKNEFVWFEGVQREVREVHHTATGKQIELVG